MNSEHRSYEDFTQEAEHYFRRNSIAVIVDNAMFGMIRLGLAPYTVLPYYIKKLNDSPLLIGLIPAVFIVGFAIPQLLMARYLQNVNAQHKRIMVASSVLQRICMLGLIGLTLVQDKLTTTETIMLFFSLYLLYNLSRGCYSPTWIDFMGRALPRNRGKVLGLGSFFGGLLNLAGVSLLTYLLDIHPFPYAITIIFSISFLASLVSLIAIISYHDVKPYDVKIGVSQESISPQISPRFIQYLTCRAITLGIEMALPFYAIYGLERYALPDTYLGIFTAILTLSDAFMNPVWGWLGDRIGYLKIAIIASIMGCLGAGIAALSTNLWLYSMVFLLTGMMLSGQVLSGINIIYEFSGNRRIPIYSAVSSVLLSPLSGLAPLLGGVLAGSLGNSANFGIAGIIGAIGTAGMIALQSSLKKQPARDKD